MSEEGMLSEGSIYALLVKKEGGGQTVTISSKKIRDYFRRHTQRNRLRK